MRRRRLPAFVLAGGLALASLLAVALTSAQPPDAAGRKVFKNSVVQLPARGGTPQGLVVTASVRDHSKDQMDVDFYLPAPQAARQKLEAKVLKGEVATEEELKAA